MPDSPSDKNLVWVDLEMTGLDPDRHAIIEIATLVTDGELNILAEGPVLAIHQSDEVLTGMDAWCVEHHGKSGLTARVRASSVSPEAEGRPWDSSASSSQRRRRLCGSSGATTGGSSSATCRGSKLLPLPDLDVVR
jgi:oligoribonuclease (3'-5' exoribonuclease)